MKQKFDMNKIKAAFKKAEPEQTTNFSNNYYPFWNIQEGEEAIIRFLPDANDENPTGFLLEKVTHKLEINGETRNVPCLKMYGEECPICKVSSAFYKEGDKANGKKFWRSKQHLAQALIVKDPLPVDKETGETHEGKVRYLSLGWQLFEVIKTAFESGDLDVPPFAFEGGCDFIIKKTKQGEYDTYAIASRFARKSRDLDDDEIEIAEEGMVDLSTLLPPKPVYEKVQAMLEAALTGAKYEEGRESREDLASRIGEKLSARKAAMNDEDEDDDSPPWEETKSKKPAAKPSKVVEDDEFEGEADEILATIRNRRKNKAE
jgi:hypothetical protein